VPAPFVDAQPSAALVWDSRQVRPACDRSAQLRDSVAVYLGRDAFEDGAPLTISVNLRRAAGSSVIIADVSKSDADGKVWGVRSVSGGETCETLDEVLTLVVALMLDAGNAEQPPQTARDQAAEPEPTTVPQQSTQPQADNVDYGPISTVPTPEPVERAPGHLFVGVGIGTTFGLLPFPSYGPQLHLAIKPRGFWGFDVSLHALGGSSVELPGSGEVGFRLLGAGAALCPLDSLHEGLWLRGCAGVQLAWVRAESRDLIPPRQETELVLVPALNLQAAQQLTGNFYIGGALGLLLPIAPNHYTFRTAQGARREAFQMASPSLGFEIFVAFRFAEL
jgi:hypothetical protein